MATFRKVSRLIPSPQRAAVITDVVADDEIDVKSILGRPARRIKVVPDDAGDEITIRLNNRVHIRSYHQVPTGVGESHWESPDTVTIVSEGEHHPLYTLTGSDEYYTEEGLQVSFIQVEDITFAGGGTSITIYCW